MLVTTYTAVAAPDDLRDTNPGQPSDLNDIVGCIRILVADGTEVDLVTYQPDEDEGQATANIIQALDEAGYEVPDWSSHSDGIRVTVTRGDGQL